LRLHKNFGTEFCAAILRLNFSRETDDLFIKYLKKSFYHQQGWLGPVLKTVQGCCLAYVLVKEKSNMRCDKMAKVLCAFFTQNGQ
jgi:hypothetical protein